VSAGLPPHHTADGKFRIPWPVEGGAERTGADMLRWMGGRIRHRPPPNPPLGALPLTRSDVAAPRAPADEIRITWVGHATFLIQAGGLNILTDPHWSRRASPSQAFGPARFVPPALAWEALPPIDAVLLSHDHYDHLDEGTVRRLRDRFGDTLRWITPLGYRGWFARRGVRALTEMDWWDEAELGGGVRVTCAPAQHWTRRAITEFNDRLWASYSLRLPDGRGIYFGGDSGYFAGYAEIARRTGPFDAVMMPVGAYDPRWFMKPAHMNPEEAVRAYADLGGRGAFIPMHWGTFRLTDEDPLEPPVRTRAAWASAALPAGDLHVLRHGETLTL
jgi:N-acyl-phosphatidylethanolamine-hydrolysing phospholipase D